MQGLIIIHHMLGQWHFRQGDRLFRTLIFFIGIGEERQGLGFGQGFHLPQGSATI